MITCIIQYWNWEIQIPFGTVNKVDSRIEWPTRRWGSSLPCFHRSDPMLGTPSKWAEFCWLTCMGGGGGMIFCCCWNPYIFVSQNPMTTPFRVLVTAWRKKERRRLIPKLVALLSCFTGRKHFAWTNAQVVSLEAYSVCSFYSFLFDCSFLFEYVSVFQNLWRVFY